MDVHISLLALFCIFFYVGLFTIGGGLVAITLMQQVIVEKYHLVTPELFFNMVAVSESTPGPMGINMATYVGTQLYGIPGSIIATCGTVLPSLIVIVIIAKFFSNFHEKPLVKAAFSCLRPCVTGVIAIALAKIFILALINPNALNLLQVFDIKTLCFYILCCTMLFALKWHPIIPVILGAIFGILFL